MSTPAEACTSERIVEFLRQPSAYPEKPAGVEVIETHISYVFLTDQNAYKLKKPVKFDFLDFTTPPRRRAACLEELRLNRRLAPNVYLAVLAVTEDNDGSLHLAGDGNEVDCVVQMRRLPADKALDRMIREDRLSPAVVTTVAALLSEFYVKLSREHLRPDAYRQALERHIRANQAALLQALPQEQSRIRRIHSAQLRYLHLQESLLDQRVTTGRIVDGHGDLRPEHIYIQDPQAVIDCIEFSPELRRVDVADELSFLAMECDRLGRSDFGERVLTAYQTACGDSIPPALSMFYRSYRACVRAKVASLQGRTRSHSQQRSLKRLTRQYINWADHYASSLGPPCVLVMFGLMGTGKSTLAHRLAKAFDVEHISTDHIRRSMFGASSSPSRYGEGIYRPESRGRIYDELFRQAAVVLDRGQPVILDGAFLSRELRNRVNEISRRHGAIPIHVLCECPPQTAKARIQERGKSGGSDSEARIDLYERQALDFEAPGSDEPTVQVNTTNSYEQQMREILEALRERLLESNS
jgi:aminoglycoside phosphotransferase family enzyme/predicted kinase